MRKRRSHLLSFCFLMFLLTGSFASAQTGGSAAGSQSAVYLQAGINFYRESRWTEAVIELRRAQASAANVDQRQEALYWISLAELSAREYENAVRDMDALVRIAPTGKRSADIPYHKGRALYYLGRYDEAVVLLKNYSDRLGNSNDNQKSAALYWIGECLFSLGQLDQARELFTLVTDKYPQSAKYEAASYRIALVNQKKVEIELLALLKWSHEESLKTQEEYQKREKSYDQALIAYQKRIADMLKDTRLSDLENSNAEYRRQLSDAEERIRELEAQRRTVVPALVPAEENTVSTQNQGSQNLSPQYQEPQNQGSQNQEPQNQGSQNLSPQYQEPQSQSPQTLRERALELRRNAENSIEIIENSEGGN